MKLLSCTTLLVATLWSSNALAIDELFEKTPGNRLSGFQAALDPTYQKECSGCHFTYLPGLLPARSWTLLMDRLDKHFGENLGLSAEARETVRRYLVDNATDKSPFTGSQVLMESLPADFTPMRVQNMPRIRSSHRVMREVIARNYHVKVRTLVNCDGCHQQAVAGDFSLNELRVEGLSGLSLIRSRNFGNN